MRKITLPFLFLCAVSILPMTLSPAQAGTVLDIYYGQVAPGQTAISGPIWLKAEFSTYDAMRTLLTITAPGLVGNDFASLFEFNFKSTIDPVHSADILAGLQLQSLIGSGSFILDTGGGKGEDSVNPGKFDISISPSNNSPSGPRLTDGETWQFLLSSALTTVTTTTTTVTDSKGHKKDVTTTTTDTIPVAISPLDFDALNSDGYWSMALIHGFGRANGSTQVVGLDDPPVIVPTAATPEPGTLILLGAGSLAAALSRRRANRSRS
jgi:hypothetical protein